MRKMGISAVYRAPKTSTPGSGAQHRVFPYLLKNLVLERANQVWAADITYLPMAKGFLYLVAIMDWASRRVLAWRTSNTLTADFCVEARVQLEQKHLSGPERAEARSRWCPEIDLAEVRMPPKHPEPIVIGHSDYEIETHGSPCGDCRAMSRRTPPRIGAVHPITYSAERYMRRPVGSQEGCRR